MATRPMVTEYDCATNTQVYRQMNDAEFAAWQTMTGLTGL